MCLSTCWHLAYWSNPATVSGRTHRDIALAVEAYDTYKALLIEVLNNFWRHIMESIHVCGHLYL